MAAWALAAALAAMGLAGAALISTLRLRRALERSGRLPRDEAELLRDAWLEEIDARGQAVLARIAAAEENWRRGRETPLASRGPVPGETAPGPPPAEGPGPRDGRALADPAAVDGVPSASAARGPGSGGAAAVAGQVRELAAQGMDPTGIAQRLGIGRGEVELILGLPEPDRG